MGAKLGSSGGPMADINVTPLIDVVLVLLVVFMVITPLLSSGLPVDLPQATTTVTVNDAGQFIVVSITRDGRWAVEQETVDEEDIVDVIRAQFADNPERTILVKADRELEYEKVREAMDLLADFGWTTIKIAANKE